MNIRPCSPADWARLCVIHDAARLHELAAAGLADAFLSLEQTAENEGLFAGEVLVAESRGQVHGFVAFTQHELTWLYVDPGKARQGIGRQLLRRAIEACAGNLSTEVLVGNEPALALYQSEGFVILRRSDGRLTGNEAYAASGYLLQHTASEAEPGVAYDCGTAP
jgi:ribosomal protein S18 acetylase RimI-like enzyme